MISLPEIGQDENIKKNFILSVLLKKRTSCHVTRWRPFSGGKMTIGEAGCGGVWSSHNSTDSKEKIEPHDPQVSYNSKHQWVSLEWAMNLNYNNFYLQIEEGWIIALHLQTEGWWSAQIVTKRAGECVSIPSLLRGRGCLRSRCEHFGFRG